MTDMITRCPSCETSFRITEAQLKTAKGSVRCGSCLQIFKAADNLVLKKKPAPPVAPPPKAPTAVSPKPVAPPVSVAPIPVTPKPAAPKPVTPAASVPTPKAPATYEPAQTEAPRQRPEPALASPEVHSEDLDEEEFSKMFEFNANEDETEAASDSLEDFSFEESPVDDEFLEDSSTDSLIDDSLLEDDFTEDTFTKPKSEQSRVLAEPSAEDDSLDDELIDQPLPDVEEFETSEEDLDSAELRFGDNDELDNDETPLTKTTFSFDQAAIDNDELSGPRISLDDDDLLISDEMEFDDDEPRKNKSAYGEDLVESFLDLDSWQPKSSSLFDRGESSKKKKNDEDGEKDPDESWAIDLLDDDDDDAYPVSAKSIDLENPDTEDDAIDSLGMIGVVDDLKRSTDDYSRINTGSFAAVGDDDLEDYDHDDHLGEQLSEQVEPSLNEDDVIDFQAPYSEPPDEDYDDYEEEYDDYSDDPKNRGALLRRIRPEPVEFAFYQGGSSWPKRLLWTGAVSLGVLVLILQVAWLQFDSLSRQEPYRDWYVSFCPMFGCTVPALDAPQLILTSNLVVRSHPNVANALMIDTILRNTAPYKQPFPDLVLTFSNLRGETLAARRFTPAEYLGGELAGKTNDMPSNQPIHLSLEIADPGPEAVNYSAYIPN